MTREELNEKKQQAIFKEQNKEQIKKIVKKIKMKKVMKIKM